MNVFISGGCKNGKSYFAQSLAKRLAAENRPLYYIATMHPVDGEDHARILRHREERQGWGFSTIEKSTEIGSMEADFNGSFLLDSVTALLSNEMFQRDGTIDTEAHVRIADELMQLTQKSSSMVLVSDYIYSDAERYDELTELYRKGLAWIDRALAQICDVVIEVAYGRIQIIKGPADFMKIMDIQEIQSICSR
ncbi:bifunctional adenosylcobinamide kinase/adenosylcobinamide-phosphate guanylyltransferase [Anoxybacterium hadale]|uniref:bifunctional adenosylcobinamide kinase/adenosylcobinamide-phosphate guanylyltransferase n=1 Tax=Anoxybacterium hadale TaxID=3408580 RepID=UPI003AFFA1E1